MAGLVHARVRESFVEYRLSYAETFPAWDNKAALAGALFASLRRWSIGLQDLTWEDSPNAADIRFGFRLPGGRATLSIGIGESLLVAQDATAWPQLQDWMEATQSALAALAKLTPVNVHTRTLRQAVHLTATGKSAVEIVRPFSPPLPQTEWLGEVEGLGFSVYGTGLTWVVDRSVAYPDSLFVSLRRVLDLDRSLAEIARIGEADRRQMLLALDLEEQRT